MEALGVVTSQMKGAEMIYLPYTSLITHIISYNKMLIIYLMSARKTHLSNIHLNMAQIDTWPNLVWQRRLLQAAAMERNVSHCVSYKVFLPSQLGGN